MNALFDAAQALLAAARPRARIATVLALAIAGSAAASPTNHLSPLGINIRDVKYWGTEIPMVDLFKKAGVGGRLWQTQSDTTWDTQEHALLDLDPQGWPRSLPGPGSSAQYRYATTLIFQGTTRFPGGRYTVFYDGEGTLYYGGGTRSASLSQPGMDIVDVNPAGGQLYVSIRQTDPNRTGNHLRNIRVIPPGGTCRNDPMAYAADASACPSSFRPFTQTYATEPFHPIFLNDIRRYAAIRFISFTGTNTTMVQEWSERVQPTVASWGAQTADGAPLEVAIQLSNLVDASPWFNVPARASDDYVLQFATLLRNQLTTPRPIYIEYNNETWNGSYPYSIHAQWMQANGLARWSSSPLDAFSKQMNWFGMRTSQVCAIVKQVFADQPGRVQCVMGTQISNTGASTSSLDCPLYVAEATGRAACHANMDVLAIGSYFGDHIQQSRFEPVWRTWFSESDGGLARLFEEIYTGVIPRQGNPAVPVGALPAIRSSLQQQAAIAQARGLGLVAYEAGSGFDSAMRPQGDPLAASYVSLQNLMVAGSRDRRMEVAFKAMLDDWRSVGGGLLMVFSGAQAWSAVAGNAATLEYTGQPRSQAPKHDAALNFLAANDCDWLGCDAGTAGTATITTIASSSATAFAGTAVILTATVSGGAPTGVVAFTADGLSIPGCEEVIVATTAACTTTSLAAGARSITAAYSGDSTHRRSRSAPVSIQVTAAPGSSNVALASAGAVASASTSHPSYPLAAVNNGDRAGASSGAGPGFWADNTPGAFPDFVQIVFNGSKTIDRVVVYSVQDAYPNSVEPGDATSFSLYGLSAFTVETWNGSAWVNAATVTGNTLVKRTVNIASTTTDRIRINVTAANTYSRIVEIEAFGIDAGPPLAASAVALVSSTNPSTSGQSVTFTATVSGSSGTPTGTVDFRDAGVSLAGCGDVALSSGTATCSTSALSVATHPISAVYSGNATYAGSTSSTVSQVVNAPAPPPGSSNVALASAGAVASASTSHPSFPLAAVNNGDRAGASSGAGPGFWADNTPGAFPDFVQIVFNGSKTIDRVVVYSVQDAYPNSVEPGDATSFSLYGLSAFTVETWNGSAWVNAATVTGNTLVKRTVNIASTTTDRIRINVTAANTYSRIVEIEAFGIDAGPPPPPPPPSSNVALASAGAVASASTSHPSFPLAAVNNGDRAGASSGAGPGFWADNTPGAFPDFVQIVFNGSKTIDRVVVYSVQDAYPNSVEPGDATSFSLYGLSAFTVETWNGSAWVNAATVTGNTLVKRTVNIASTTTDRIRINVTAANTYSRIVEIEAFGF